MSEIEIKDGYVIDMGPDDLVTRVGRAIDAELSKAGITLPMMPVTAAMARAAITAIVDWKIEKAPRLVDDSQFTHVERGLE